MQGLLWTGASIALSVSLLSLSLPPKSVETLSDVDLGNDCQREYHEFGDAPEGILAYPAVVGAFPTCITPGPMGTRTEVCGPGGGANGPAGYVEHVSTAPGPNYWLGCFGDPPFGVDGEPDGKTNTPAVGFSACVPGLLTDCVEATPWGMMFDQDECYGDAPPDASLRSLVTLLACLDASVPINTSNCGPDRQVFLNICVDMNADGDWLDSFRCPDDVCASEWPVRNAPIVLPPGCFTQPSPVFRVGPNVGPSWMRISISDNPAAPDYAWNGTRTTGGGGIGQQGFANGETEDYPITIDRETPTTQDTWGRLKIKYRP